MTLMVDVAVNYVDKEKFIDEVRFIRKEIVSVKDGKKKTIVIEQVPTVLSGELNMGELITYEKTEEENGEIISFKSKTDKATATSIKRVSDERVDGVRLSDFKKLKTHKSYLAIASIARRVITKTDRGEKSMTYREVYILSESRGDENGREELICL